ncbi:MPP6 [Cordylochernes scorpioides]|uniref:MPP6 n=1 Tax=Cordylochernes scorpioides TaxID=51811 RepID=A0ABY6KQR1_9ARAC|nr:MPP6 [Cordylochernes scorpioides]
MLEEVYSKHALSKSQCYRWFKKFQNGDFELDNEPHGKPPQKFEDAELQALLDEDSTQMQEKLAKQLQVSQGAVSLRLNSLGMTQKLSRWVPHEHEKKSFLHRIVTSDEKWIHFSNPTRQKSWGLPGQFPKQTPRPNRFGKKAMLCIWWDQTGVVYFELLKPGKMVQSMLEGRSLNPAQLQAKALLQEVQKQCGRSGGPSARELAALLASPHFKVIGSLLSLVQLQRRATGARVGEPRRRKRRSHEEPEGQCALLEAHDQVATKSYQAPEEEEILEEPSLKMLSSPQCPDDTTVRLIGIRKGETEPLGLTVRVENGRLLIARILAGGIVDRQGLLHVGDTILEVNANVVQTPDQLRDQLQAAKSSVTFKILPSFQDHVPTSVTFMKALYSYNPAEDSLLPCKEIGLSFNTGDILHILNQEDPNWWQARVVGSSGPAGLIPSQELEERRRAFVKPEFDLSTKTTMCGTKVTKKKRKTMYQSKSNSDYTNSMSSCSSSYKYHLGLEVGNASHLIDLPTLWERTLVVHWWRSLSREFDKAELLLYEEVARMPPFRRKTLVLLGSQGVGRRTMKSRLIQSDPEKFSCPLPHTSRTIKEGEEDGRQYHFVCREVMEADIAENQYLEWGEHNGNLYGTKLDSIRAILRTDKMCVLDCNPQSLKLLKTSEFLPYVVLISAPPLEQLRQMHEYGRQHSFANSSFRSLTVRLHCLFPYFILASGTFFDRAMGRHSSRRARTLESLASLYEDEDLKATIEESARLLRAYNKDLDLVLINTNFDKTFHQLKEAIDSLATQDQWVPISWVY